MKRQYFNKYFKKYLSWFVVFAWMIIAFVAGGAVGAATSTLLTKISNNSSLNLALVGFASYATILIVIVIIIKKYYKEKDVLGFLGMRRRIGWKDIAWTILAFIVYYVVSWAIIWLL